MKIGFFITARLKSSRLKHKILLDLNGKSVLQRIIDRCKATHGVDNVVLCTSTCPQDSILYDYALKNGIQFYAGSEEDVLQRLLDAAYYYGYDAFVSITADNPLFSIYTSQLLIDQYKTAPFDFGFTKGLPIGIGTTMIDTKALDVAVYMKSESDTEIWGPFVNRPDFFGIFNLIVENSPFSENIRLTLDYSEDYILINEIYQSLGKYSIKIQNLMEYLRNEPELLRINEKRKQTWPSNGEIEVINEKFNNYINNGKAYAEKIAKPIKPSLKETKIHII